MEQNGIVLTEDETRIILERRAAKALFLAYREARNEMDFVLLDRSMDGIEAGSDKHALVWQHWKRTADELEKKILERD